jgi:glycosyltransferase involved in cell wall biosynthesis
MADSLDLTIVMPCLNEAETLARCCEKARLGLERAGVTGEVLVADNGSTDGSQALAEKHGARVVPVSEKGYGNALRGGIEAAHGRWLLMGDADDSYDFSEAAKFVEKLRTGDDLVMGCRLPAGGGTIMPGAMPWKNRWLGNPVLSFLGRLFFRTPIRDFHCGLRAFTKDAYRRMELKTTGMEFASEMVMKASLQGMKMSEVPITLHKDGRSRPPHLLPWRDGWRHLRFMLIYSPRWLFLAPGILLSVLGVVLSLALYFNNLDLLGWHPGLTGFVTTCSFTIVGLQLMAFAFFTKVFGVGEGLLPPNARFTRLFDHFTLERGLIFGLVLLAVGLVLFISGLLGLRNGEDVLEIRRTLAGTTLVVLALQGIFSSFFMSVLGLKTVSRKPPEPTGS